MGKLNDKQRRFVAEYAVDLNATQAAIRAGYSEKTAYSQGQRLLKNVEVSEAIEGAEAERLGRLGVRAEWVLEKLVENVNRSMRAQAVLDEDGEPIGDYRYEGAVANRALELLGKHLRLFGGDSAGVNVNVSVDNRREAEREERFGRLYAQLDAYRTGFDDGDRGGGGGVRLDPGGADDTPAPLP